MVRATGLYPVLASDKRKVVGSNPSTPIKKHGRVPELAAGGRLRTGRFLSM